MGRVVFHHPDGRSCGGNEEEWDIVTANPFNFEHKLIGVNPFGEEAIPLGHDPGRPEHLHVSLKDEGFVVVADIAETDYTVEVERQRWDGTTYMETVQVFRGHEIPRDGKAYRGETIHRHSKPTKKGEEAAQEHAERRRVHNMPLAEDHPDADEVTFPSKVHWRRP
jgi:hypothetical protein